ncbi:CDP-glycerol glycerophosphotransferase family protein [Bacillus mojavensis]|uniref:CDP-glycerol glycerophosphotransferase family protein n=1 Tax=Bacillus mojavensis TaxID=72360 RepID=UPI002DBDED2D|nr:CDP-glycerol glycerophosphotransferase family protein [Bacillus mojavensis]MEC1291785.1 CDP-glycerol glycerophosphotransferase family protein [Bacillus mojavensis]MEC1613523.1 CDP-glycerol glycerophosphotransferase family protein [Bacillus mojavensis]MEC1622665.1 CDP-glycerol glycerophosphotransferase family protein [Bacillus mojavensis]MEC1659556.1 CDP-glycerol glycerophosphotransferase family protein [Bacillus mojavensis]MEC1682027.1 CDP-glycerol glycerophosphotransferase family protein [
MSAYLSNYWVLYRKYVELFDRLRYKEIPLGLISNFYQYISPELRVMMEEEPELFGAVDQYIDDEQIQPFFEEKIQNIVKTNDKPVKGKVILHFDYLRFSSENYQQFNPGKTAVLAKWSLPDYCGLPVICKRDLVASGQKGDPKPYLEKAMSILSAFDDHPAFGDQAFRDRLCKDIPLFMEAIDAVEALFTQEKISAVVVGTTEDIYSRVLALMCKRRGAVSICLQHGALMGDEAFLPIFATYQAVFGAYEAEWFKQKGCKPEQILVTGHPRFDQIFNKPPMDMFMFYRKLGFHPSKKIVLIATQPASENFYIDVLKGLSNQKQLQIIIKPHPWEIGKNKLDLYHAAARKHKACRVITKELDLYDLLPYADAAVTQTSTVGLEAMLFQKPVLIGKSSGNRTYPYYESLGDFMFDQPDKLVRTLIEVLRSPAVHKKAEEARLAFIAANYPVAKSTNALLAELKAKTGVDYRQNNAK